VEQAARGISSSSYYPTNTFEATSVITLAF